MLITLVAAPLDNYWHELYGIDVTLWSPFHIMGITGGILGIIGFVYAFASEAAVDRQQELLTHRFLGLSTFEWGALLVLSALMELPLIALLQFATIDIGPWRILTYPLILTFASAFCLTGADYFTRKPGTATLLALLLALYTVIIEATIPLGLRTLVVQQGLTFRPGLVPPLFNLSAALMPAVFIASGLIIDSVLHRQLRSHGDMPNSTTHTIRLTGATLALPSLVVPLCIVHTTASLTHTLLLRPVIVLPQDLQVLAVLLCLLLASAIGTIGVVWGAVLGEIWHWSTQ